MLICLLPFRACSSASTFLTSSSFIRHRLSGLLWCPCLLFGPKGGVQQGRSYDCCIDLLPSSSPHRGQLYSLSPLEKEALQTYILLGQDLFFVDKKDKTLHPCIDYWGLNSITILNRYPLPLISSAFELLQDAKFLTKLDLCNSYHLVTIREGDEWKTAFSTPRGHYEYLVMPFGLTNALIVFQATSLFLFI